MRTSTHVWTLLFVPFLVAASECNTDGGAPTCSVASDQDGDGAVSVDCGGDDCDDNDRNRFPGNAEICDSDDRDEDCDPTTVGRRDVDSDGFIDAACCNSDGEGLVCGDDCDDLHAGTHPLQNEVCNQRDDNCDGVTDEGVQVALYVDTDGDAYGAGEPVLGCHVSPGYADVAGDCDDTLPAVVPGAQRCSSYDVQICQGGVWTSPMACGGQNTCVQQPNGTGVCL